MVQGCKPERTINLSKDSMRLLVTGGAGYIGSHFVDQALKNGLSEVVVIDDLSTGIGSRLPTEVRFHNVDIADPSSQAELVSILRDNIDVVVHFAAKKVVGDSVNYPEEYFRNNIGGTLNLLSAMRHAGVFRLIFSSSAAVYGEPDDPVVYENTPCRPINPYGQSKLISEQALSNAAKAWGLRAVALRYFNVAGAINSVLADTTTTNLMPAIREQLTQGGALSIFGNDYDTEDGTCVRDYVHIVDLVEAHLAALNSLYTYEGSGLDIYNVGTGRGTSVLEIVQAFQSLPGVNLNYIFEDRREGDPGALTADVKKIATELRWSARYTTHDIVESVIANPPLSS